MKFWAINVVRRVGTRTARVQSPIRHRFTQRICDGTIRLVRGKFTPLSAEVLKRHYGELRDLQSSGLIEVREGTVNGPVHDFSGTTKDVGLTMPAPEARHEEEPEAAAAPAEVEASSEESVPGGEAGPVPDMTWSKAALVKHAALVLNISVDDLDAMTKRQILEKLS